MDKVAVSGAGTYPARLRRWLIIATVITATMLQMIDGTIVNVALPHMQASLGATRETVSWTLSSYLIAVAVAMPATGWLEARLGRRRLYAIAIGGFVASSALCGAATSIETMVCARVMQGLFGALTSPLGQATILDCSPLEKRPQVMMLYGLGVLVGTTMGPILGGILTENFHWRWVFFVNVPIGLCAFAGVLLLVEDTARQKRSFDYFGFGALVLGLACLQLALDRGTLLDWFDSPEIIIQLGLGLAALWVFLVHSATASAPLFPASLWRDRNFVIANLVSPLMQAMLVASSVLISPMLQSLFGYDALSAGWAMLPRGFGIVAGTLLAGWCVKLCGERVVLGMGIVVIALSHWWMLSFNLQMGVTPILWSGLFQGIGAGLVLLPVNLLGFATLRHDLRTDGAAFFYLSRNFASSVAVAALTALLARNVQIAREDIVGNMHLPQIPLGAGGRGMQEQLAAMLSLEIDRQALMIAYLNDFWLMFVVSLGMLPLLMLFMSAPRNAGRAAEPMAVAEA